MKRKMLRLTINNMVKGLVKALPLCLFAILLFFASCGKDETPTVDVYENWQQRNDAFMASLEDSLKNGTGAWMKLTSYSKTPGSEKSGDCIYVKILEEKKPGETESPMFNDSVRISYEGRLMPTKQPLNGTKFEDGKVFDTTVYGAYDARTNATVRFKVSGLVNGFSTAMLHMHRGETWLVYIPYSLGYGSSVSNSLIPAYSTLIFKVTLHEFAREGKALPKV